MKTTTYISKLIPSVALAIIFSPMIMSAQSAGQDMKDAGKDTKKAAKNTGSGIKKGTVKAADKTKEGGDGGSR